mmetsp:Transcript_5427/g.9792  ORF Transcript_5427/g.9792 Transcript_5427/m.9792 type:complete len:679 (+) Transcript_5427:28-2064(+)
MWRTLAQPLRSVSAAAARPNVLRVRALITARPPVYMRFGLQTKKNAPWSLGGLRAYTSPSVRKHLHDLQKAADSEPYDSEKQRKYYAALLQAGEAKRVVSRYDSRRFAADEDVVKMYIQACIEAGVPQKVKNIDFSGVIPKTQPAYGMADPTWEGPQRYGEPQMGAANVLGSPDQPMHVQFKGDSWRDRIIGSTISALALLMVFGTAAFVGGYFASDRLPGVGRRGSQNTVAPVNISKICFDDVKGCKEAKLELQEIVEFLKEPEKFTRLGGELPRGVLLMGPPGTGKTLLAKAVAGEAGVPFFSASGSEFEEMYVGVGARRVRDLFAAAKERAPCLIFIDEIDAIGGTRKAKEQQSMRLTLNQLLVELDGFNTNSGVIVLAATNFPELLDNALVRAGRFDRHITVPLPDIRGRTEILNLYTSKLPLSKNVDCKTLARGTPGYSGADLSTMVNDAAIHASMRGSDQVTQEDFEYAKDKMFMGPERKSAYLTPESRKLTAYHEGGHAIVAMNTDGAHPVHKATIMPRGNALGMVFQLPNGDQTSVSRKQLIAEMDVCMGGRAAEEMIFGRDNVTTGASSDMRRATQIARDMVLKYGMSDKVGVIDFGRIKETQLSDSTRVLIDEETKKLLDESYNRVTNILNRERPQLEKLAKALMHHETLTGPDIDRVLKGQDVGDSI